LFNEMIAFTVINPQQLQGKQFSLVSLDDRSSLSPIITIC